MCEAALLLAALATVSSPSASVPAAPDQAVLQPADVMAQLEKTIAWYRLLRAYEPGSDIAEDLASREHLRQIALQVLRLGFVFARAEAAFVPSPRDQTAGAPAPDLRPAQDIEQTATRLRERVAGLESRLSGLDTEIARATGHTRQRLVDQRDAITADLGLAKTIQETFASILRFATTSALTEGGADSLSAQINNLARSIPELVDAPTASSPSGTVATSGTLPASNSGTSGTSGSVSPLHPESAGLLGLITELVGIEGARRELDAALGQTADLAQSIEQRRRPLTDEAGEFLRRGDVATTASVDDAHLASTRRELQVAVARFKQLSTMIVPLGEQGVLVGTARETLAGWRARLTQRTRVLLRYLVLRAALLGATVAIVLFVSGVWRRATLRHVRDARRRRQMLLLRRVVIGGAIVLVLMVALASEIGSLTTYAGFVTAGVAVALQNVILAVVAYFFLIGRYGVRVGDRITIAGVTGSVVDIGLVRIYLMELAGPDWRPTGRIVVFSNAVLFQPAALFKQTPGVDYLWHTVSLTLAPETGVEHAEQEVGKAVDAVYDSYRGSIEQQHATLQQTLNVQTPVPRPETHVRYTPEGIELSVRYPVEREQARAIDSRIMTAIHDAIANDHGLKVAASGAPRLADAQ